MNLVKDYKQYFTPDKLAAYMVSIIPNDTIKTVVDLSMGECGLLEEAKKCWSNAELYGADINKELIKKINKKSPYIKTYLGDSLSVKLENWKSYNEIVNNHGFDLAIANPPFNFYDQVTVNINESQKMALPIEMRFLLKYMDIVKENGYICIILPYGFLSLDLYKNLRTQLLKMVTIVKVIKIFDRCFDKIDADTCLILMKKKKKEEKNTQAEILIEYLDSNYNLSNGKMAVVNQVDRWDLEYQYLLSQTDIIVENTSFERTILANYIKSCGRGKSVTKNKEFLVDKGIRFIHTTDVKKLYISNENKRYVCNNKNFFENAVLQENNVLIGRVGQGCIGKIGIVSKRYPKMFFSDCLFAIQTKHINPYYLTLFLASEFGQIQFRGLAKGSCSKYITQEGLFNICVLVPDEKIQDYFGNKYKMLLSKPGCIDKERLFTNLLEELNEVIKKKE